MKIFRVVSLMTYVLLAACPAHTQDIAFVERERIEALFSPQATLQEVKIAVDAMVDPSTDSAATKSMIAHMADEVGRLAEASHGSAGKLEALKRYLYTSGPWNDGRPFQYDLDDPLGEKPQNRLLQHYLTTRRGNCITMPLLLLMLGQRLGLHMTLAEAPLHVFVKYTDDEGKMWNLEATSGGGLTRDAWYRQKLPMSDNAVTNGIYLRALSHEESAALIASFLVEDRIATGNFEAAISVADVLLRHYPNFAYGLVKKGSAYSGLLRRELAGKFARTQDIPAELKAKADQWYQANLEAFAKAEALGWRPEDGELQ